VDIVHQDHQNQLSVLLVIIALQVFLPQNLVLSEPMGIHLAYEGRKIAKFAIQVIIVMELA